MNTQLTIAVATVSCAIAGCATSTANYTPPTEVRIVNTKFVDKPFDIVWDSLVKELSSDFFVINNIDKNSRLINISFTSQHPSDFVDCGISNRTFKNARGNQNYSYKTADTSNFTMTNDQGLAFHVYRKSRLEGRTNIYVAPENTGTNVTVNTKYVLTVATVATTIDGRPAGTENFVFDPSTKQPFSNGTVTCTAVGEIEDRILRAAK